jgi:hypothetical protein
MMRNHHRREIAIRVARGLGSHHAGVHTIHGLYHLRRERCVSGGGSVRWSIATTMALCVRSNAHRDVKRESKTNRSAHSMLLGSEQEEKLGIVIIA